MSDLDARANVHSIFSEFNITSAAELEVHINMDAIAAKAKFEKHYNERLTDVSKLWVDQKRRMDVREPLEVPTLSLNVGEAKFDFKTIPDLFKQKLVEREETKKKRAEDAAAGDTTANISVSTLVDQEAPLKLRLTGADYTNIDKVVAAIKDDKTITRLEIANCGLEADDCDAISVLIKENKTITSLDISGNKITGEGVEKLVPALCHNATLTDLDLGGNGLMKSAARHLTKVLQTTTTQLKRLQLGGNNLGIYGAEELAVGLKSNNSLQALGLQNNSLGSDGIAKLIAMLEHTEDGTPSTCNASLILINTEANKVEDTSLIGKLQVLCKRNENRQMLLHVEELEAKERATREHEAIAQYTQHLHLIRHLMEKERNDIEQAKAAAAEAAAKKKEAEAAKAQAPAGSAGVKKGTAAPSKIRPQDTSAPTKQPAPSASGKKPPSKSPPREPGGNTKAVPAKSAAVGKASVGAHSTSPGKKSSAKGKK